jgi:hypothetical protein
LLFYGALNDAFNNVAAGVVILWMKHPSADGGGLISQLVEVVRGEDDSPDGLFGLFAKSVAALIKCCFDGSNI